MTAQLKFVKLHLNKPQNVWNDVLWTKQPKVETFDLKCTATEQWSEAPEQSLECTINGNTQVASYSSKSEECSVLLSLCE